MDAECKYFGRDCGMRYDECEMGAMQGGETVLQISSTAGSMAQTREARIWAVHAHSMLIRFVFAARVIPDLRFVQSTVPPRLRLPITGRFDKWSFRPRPKLRITMTAQILVTNKKNKEMAANTVNDL